MKTSKLKAFLLLIFILLTYFTFGVNASYFMGNYESWKLIGAEEFPSFYELQSVINHNIVFLPMAVLTVINLILIVYKPSYVNIGLLILSAVLCLGSWACVNYWQAPVFEDLAKNKSVSLIDELMKTETIRFSLLSVQFLAVTFMLWKILSQLSPKKR